jgi:DNA modification methylase
LIRVQVSRAHTEDRDLAQQESLVTSARHRIYFADARRMPEVPTESVHLVVTSPPYWQIKDYGHPDQIGFQDGFTEYVKKLNEVWCECLRVLHPGCRLCINIGDMYIRASSNNLYQIIPLHAHLVNDITTIGGLVYLGSVIWEKISTTRTTGGASVMGSYGYPRNGYVSLNYEYIAIFKKRGKAPPVSPDLKSRARMSLARWRKLFTGIWRFPGVRQTNGIAMFPEELPRRLIEMFSFEEDTVLDPFLGSGTTVRAADQMNRNSIGYEIGFHMSEGPAFEEVIKRKIGFYDAPPDRQAAKFFFGSR